MCIINKMKYFMIKSVFIYIGIDIYGEFKFVFIKLR